MEWQQLEYFRTVAQVQHVTQAAKILSISQPALSRAIARLEEELGVPLFDRQGRSVQLNAYGKIFLARVQQALAQIEEGKKEIRDRIDPDQGVISLAFLHTFGTNFIPEILGEYRRVNPNVRFQLTQNSYSYLLQQLESGEVDLCMISPKVDKKGVRWDSLLTEELYLVVPQGHRLSDRDQVSLEEVARDSFISLKEGFGLRTITDQLCEQAGFLPDITFEGEEVTTIAGLVSAGLGVSVMPAVKGIDLENTVLIPVSTPICRREIGMAWMENRYMSPAVLRFKEFVLDFFRN